MTVLLVLVDVVGEMSRVPDHHVMAYQLQHALPSYVLICYEPPGSGALHLREVHAQLLGLAPGGAPGP
jgi:hypothetical protein